MRYIRHQRIGWVRVRKETQNTEKHLGDRECRTPLTLQNIKADATRCVDIRMIDFRFESDDWRLEWIIGGKINAEAKYSALERAITGPEYQCLPGEEICIADGARRTVCRRIFFNICVFSLQSSECHRACGDREPAQGVKFC